MCTKSGLHGERRQCVVLILSLRLYKKEREREREESERGIMKTANATCVLVCVIHHALLALIKRIILPFDGKRKKKYNMYR